MYVIKLENTVTHQIHQFESDDMNNGNKLYYELNINTLELVDGEYILTLCDSEDNVLSEDVLRIGDFNPQTLQYKAGGDTYISIEFDARIAPKKVVLEAASTIIEPDEGYDGFTYVEIDANSLVDNAKNEGYNEGVEYQKGQLSTIDITENGVYTNENGYSEVVVNVPDLNGSYDDGYEVGRTDGYNQGKDEGYTEGYDKGNSEGYGNGYEDGYAEGEQVSYGNGYEDGKQSVAADARVLDVTENGRYLTEFSETEYIIPEIVTGVFNDGTVFYSWGEIVGGVYDTGAPYEENTRVEFWWKPAQNSSGDAWYVILGASLRDGGNNGSFEIRYYGSYRDQLQIRINGGIKSFNFSFNNEIWNHFLFENNSLYVNDEFICSIDETSVTERPTFYINGAAYKVNRNANGLFGMIKIGNRTFVPSEGGFMDYDTKEMLNTDYPPTYIFTKNEVIVLEGEGPLYKTINVNVSPKLDIKSLKVSLGYSSFDKVPQGLVDWTKVTNMYSMFRECQNLKEFKEDTSKVTEMSFAFYNCTNLSDLDIDTSNVTSMNHTFNGCTNLSELNIDTSNVTGMTQAFYGCTNLSDLDMDTSNVIYMTRTFQNCKALKKEAIAKLDTSNVVDMSNAFNGCTFDEFPSLDTSKVTNMESLFNATYATLKKVNPIDTSKVTNISYMFYDFSGEHILEEIPEFDCTNVTNVGSMFSYYQDKMDKFTTCGGWKNLKCKWDDNYGLRACANLSYQSCINILNGLYDFTGNGETPTYAQGKLKVHQNFLDTVGDKISIGTNKGWTITT
jgi:surface protein